MLQSCKIRLLCGSAREAITITLIVFMLKYLHGPHMLQIRGNCHEKYVTKYFWGKRRLGQ